MVTVIKNGTIVTNTTEYISDVKIENGTIVEIGSIRDIVGAEVIDASSSFLFPGFIDPHTHIDMGMGSTKTADDFTSGSRAAIAGGTTTIIDFITQEKGNTLSAALQLWHHKAEGKSFCDYGFHMGIIEWNDEIRREMSKMVTAGVTSFKMYMAYRDNLQVNDEVIYEGLQESKRLNSLIGFHCENGDLIEARTGELLAQGKTGPYYHQIAHAEEVETEAIYRLTQIAKLTKAPIWVVHLSTKKGLEIINDARRQGIQILVETCPQYLVIDNSCFGEATDRDFNIAKFVMSPPPRDKKNQASLWKGLSDGSIEMVSSDHCSFNYVGQKKLGLTDFSKIPNGASGVEHRLSLLYTYGVMTGKITKSQLVGMGATNPAKAFGLIKKGSIEVGMDGDILIYNPADEWSITAKKQYQNADYTPYEGIKIQGRIDRVLLRGETVYKQGKLTDEPQGLYQHRGPSTVL